MKILAVSYLYPNKIYPNYGIFVLNRLKAVHIYHNIIVINPIPWFPFSSKFKRYKNFDRIPRQEIIDGIDVYHPRFFIIPRHFKLLDAFTFCIAVTLTSLRLWRKFKFDIIDLHWTYPDLLSGKILSKLFGKKFLVTIRGKEALNYFVNDTLTGYTQEISLRTRLIKYLLPKSHSVIALSDELKNICLSNGVNQRNVRVIRNGVSTDKFYFIGQKDSRLTLNLSDNQYILLCVGSLIYGKGFDRLIRIFDQINTIYPNVVLYIIGTEGPAGDYYDELRELVRVNNVCAKVKFVGQVNNDDLLYWYNAADLFCLVSRGEGSPNVLTEALACGCPSVATDVGSVSDIMTEKYMGSMVPNDGALLLPGIMEAIEKDYDRPKIAQHMAHYNWDWCAKKVIKVYTKIIEDLG